MWQCDRCHCWRHARCCKGESPGDCGCGRGDAARRVALAKASCESKEDRPLADALVIRQRLAAVCAISERSPGLLPSEVVRSFSRCWLHADQLAKTILNRNGSSRGVFRHRGDKRRKAADELRSSLQQARRVVRGDARAVAAVAAAARQLPSSEDRASFNEHARALFDRIGQRRGPPEETRRGQARRAGRGRCCGGSFVRLCAHGWFGSRFRPVVPRAWLSSPSAPTRIQATGVF